MKNKKLLIILSVVILISGMLLGFFINEHKSKNIPKEILEVTFTGSLSRDEQMLKFYNMTEKEIKDVAQNNDDYIVVMYRLKMMNDSKYNLALSKINAKSDAMGLWVKMPSEKVTIKSRGRTTKYFIVAVKGSGNMDRDEIIKYLKENTSFSIRGEKIK